MKNFLLPILSLGFLFSCSGNQVTERNAEVEVLTSEIASMMPGTLHVTENYFVWTDPMSVQNQAHVLDKATAEEVGSLIDIGQGPDEYIAPIYTVGEGNTLLACDISRKQIGYYALDSLRAKGNPLLKREDADIFAAIRVIEIEDGKFLTFDLMKEKPFIYEGKAFGKDPLDLNYENKYDILQGNVAYNPENKRLVYSTISFPYLAVYQKTDTGFDLLAESPKDFEYTLSENEIHLDGKRIGASELTLTRDYIVTLQRDYAKDNTDETTVGRDVDKRPTTLFVYDYALNLKEIVNLNMPVMRITSETKSNTIYLIGVQDDFILGKVEL